MTVFGVLVLIFMVIGLFYSAREAFAEQEAKRWMDGNTFRAIWEGTIGLTPMPSSVSRYPNTTLLHIVLVETPRTFVILEVDESFPALTDIAQKTVVYDYLGLIDKSGDYDRFYTCRDIFIH